MFCTNCGKEVQEGTEICEYCGQKIEVTQYLESVPLENKSKKGIYTEQDKKTLKELY